MTFLFYASLNSFKRFTHTLLPVVYLEVARIIPFSACSVMVGNLGDPIAVAAYGLYNFFANVLIMPFLESNIEVAGIFFSKKYGERDFRGLATYFYRSILVTVVMVIFYAGMAFGSESLFLVMGVEAELSARAASIAKLSVLYYPLSYLTFLLQTFMMSQNIQNEFNGLTLVTVPIVLILGRVLIVDLDFKEQGVVPTFLITCITQAVYTFVILAKHIDRRGLQLPTFQEILEELPFFVKKSFYSAVAVFVDQFMYEFNTFLVTQMGRVDELAVYVSWVAVMTFPYFLATGIGSAVRTNIGQIMGAKHQLRARREAIAYFFYSFIFLMLMALGLWVFAEEVARLFIDNEEFAPRVAECLRISAVFFYFDMMIDPTMAVLRLLNLDAYFMKTTVFLFFTLNAAFTLFLGFGLGMGAFGIVLGFCLAMTVGMLEFFRKIFFACDWESVKESEDELGESLQIRSYSFRTH